MKKINLLPIEARRSEQNMVKLYFVVTAFFMSIAFCFTLYNYLLLERTKAHLSEVQSTYANITVWQDRKNKIDDINKKIDARMQLIKAVQDFRPNWFIYFAELGRKTPDGVSITGIEWDEKLVAQVQGEALTMDKVLEYVKVLEKSPLVKSVTLQKANTNTVMVERAKESTSKAASTTANDSAFVDSKRPEENNQRLQQLKDTLGANKPSQADKPAGGTKTQTQVGNNNITQTVTPNVLTVFNLKIEFIGEQNEQSNKQVEKPAAR